MLTTPLTAYGRSPNGSIQAEAVFTFSDPTLVEFKEETKYVARCALAFNIGVKTIESTWEVVTDANDLTEEALICMHVEALDFIKKHKGHTLLEHFHEKYHTGFNMKLETALEAAIEAISSKVEAAITGKPERATESAFDTDRQFENTSRAK